MKGPKGILLALVGLGVLGVVWMWALGPRDRGARGVSVRAASPHAPERAARGKAKVARDVESAATAGLADRDAAKGGKVSLAAALDDIDRSETEGLDGAATAPAAPQRPKGPMGGHAAPREVAALDLDPAQLAVVQDLARFDAACAAGHQSACARLDAHGQDGRRQLGHLEHRLAEACKGGHQFEACRLRGDLALRRRHLDEAGTWLRQARVLATSVRSRCAEGHERASARCTGAEHTLSLLAAQEAELKSLSR